MSMPHPLKHIDHFGEASLDTTTLRHLREAAVKANEEDERIRDQIVTKQGRMSWDVEFARDSVERSLAITRIDRELKSRMVPIETEHDFLEVQDTPEEAAQLLDWFGKRTDLDLKYEHELEPSAIPPHLRGCGNPDSAWLVHKEHGGRNDREWTLVAMGQSPLEALREAHKAFCDGR